MNTSKTVALLLVVAGVSEAATETYFWDGNALAEDLRKSEQTPNAAYYEGRYTGYVMGVADPLVSFSWCPPASVTQRQVTSIVSKYLKANPQNWHMPAYYLVLNAVNEAFPCRKAGK